MTADPLPILSGRINKKIKKNSWIGAVQGMMVLGEGMKVRDLERTRTKVRIMGNSSLMKGKMRRQKRMSIPKKKNIRKKEKISKT